MSLHDVKFNHDWLKEIDGSCRPFKVWCEPSDSASCIVCKKTLNIRNMEKN